MTNRTFRILLTVYTLVLAYLSLAPMNRSAPTPRFLVELAPTFQNALHVPCYALLVMLGMGAFSSKKAGAKRVRGWVMGTALAYGTLLEALQAFIPGRSASLGDFWLNAVGVLAGLWLWRFVPAGLAPMRKDLMGSTHLQ